MNGLLRMGLDLQKENFVNMNVTKFIEEWNRTHTSQPSIQDVIDWCEDYFSKKAFHYISGICTYLPPDGEKPVCMIDKFSFIEYMKED